MSRVFYGLMPLTELLFFKFPIRKINIGNRVFSLRFIFSVILQRCVFRLVAVNNFDNINAVR